MQQINPTTDNKVQEVEILAGIKLVRTEVRVQTPVFEEVTIQKPKFEEVVVKVPVGFDKVANDMALEISKTVLALVETQLNQKLDRIIDDKLASLKNVKIVEEVTVNHRDVEVERPVYKDVEVSVPKFVDKEVINPVLKDVTVTNAILVDKAVTNAIVQDVRVTNAIITDVEVERAVIREKVIEVLHKTCLDQNGNPL